MSNKLTFHHPTQEDNYTSAVDSVVKNSHSIVGQCLSDTLIVVSNEGPSPPVICGENSGQHMYTSLSGVDDVCVLISLYISGAAFTRSVNIKATQVSVIIKSILQMWPNSLPKLDVAGCLAKTVCVVMYSSGAMLPRTT